MKDVIKQATETTRQRAERIAGSSNGATTRTRVIPNKKRYVRHEKHRSSETDER